MKYLLLLIYLSYGRPVMEHRWFDQLEHCMAAGQVRANFLAREGLTQPLMGGCLEVKLEQAGSKDGNPK